jgi:hypothetical protein
VLAVKALLVSLCVLALVVAASALRRLDLYESAFGATRARLLAGAIEVEVAVVLLLVLVAGVRWSGTWLPRAVAASAALMLLGIAVVDADALVARRNVERFADSGRIDTAYLSRLSADAVPALDRLPEPQRFLRLRRIAAALAEDDGGWASAKPGPGPGPVDPRGPPGCSAVADPRGDLCGTARAGSATSKPGRRRTSPDVQRRGSRARASPATSEGARGSRRVTVARIVSGADGRAPGQSATSEEAGAGHAHGRSDLSGASTGRRAAPLRPKTCRATARRDGAA